MLPLPRAGNLSSVRRVHVGVLFLAAFVLSRWWIGAAAEVDAQVPPADVPTSIRVSDDVVTRGQHITVVGDGWRPNTRVEIFIESRRVGDAGVDPSGEFVTSVEVPLDLNVDRARLSVSGVERLGSESTYELTLEIGQERPRGIWITIGGAALLVLVILGLAGSALRGRARRAAARTQRSPGSETRTTS